MQVSDILKTKGDRVVAIEPGASIPDIAGTLRREDIGAAVVKDRDGALLGIVSERDIVRSIADEGPECLNRSATDLMSSSLVTCQPEDSTEDLMEKMLAEQIRHLPVYDDGKLVGIISIGDVVRGALSELKWRENVLRQQVVTAVGWSTDED